MPITINFNHDTLRPNYPNDRNAAGYFSHVKAWSIRDGGIYIPPTAGEWNRFTRRITPYSIQCENNLSDAQVHLTQINLFRVLGIDASTFIRRFRENPEHSYGYRTNSVGTDALQIIQTAFNSYVHVKRQLGTNAWKVDYIHTCRNDMNNRQDDGFRGRCIFQLNNHTISELVTLMETDFGFWQRIYSLYNQLAVRNHRIANPDYADRPVVTRRRNTSVSPAPGTYPAWSASPPPVRPAPREPAPSTRLAQEYLSRTVVDDSIPAEQLAEMLRRAGNSLSGEVRDMIYDMLMADFNGSIR